MEWEIQGLSQNCSGCQSSFQDQNPFYCFLLFPQGSIPQRKDFCKNCVDQAKADYVASSTIYSYWEGHVHILPLAPKPKPLPYERFETLLRKYIVSKEPHDQKFAYILALLLERKKILIHRESVRKEEAKNRFLIYEHAETEESFILEDPTLTLSQVEEVQNELKEVMDEALLNGHQSPVTSLQ
ncbi:MAG: hypothetical protein HYS07_08840 [Chlamydiae bacterium]|nr:hypothetical protein [Chlamydiota bacterium]MBI3277004.1 hypothetical protein [Chlamydiota bacterium]